MKPVVRLIQPTGILDGTKTPQFRQEVSELLQQGTQIIVVDLQDVTFMDSSGLGTLVLSLKTVQDAGAQLYLCSINEQIKILFQLTNMEKVFQIFGDRGEFKEKILKAENL
jgi:anti-anti-sigma factor